MKRALLVAALAACHHAPPAAPHALSVIEALPPIHDFRGATSLVELDGTVYLFGAQGLTIVRAGAVAADHLPADTHGTTIPALEGTGRWVVGGLQRVTPEGELAPLGEARLGLPPELHWSALYGAGPTFVAVSPTKLAVAADGRHVALFAAPPQPEPVAVAAGRVALAGPTAIELWDLAAGTSRAYPLGHAQVLFADADGARSRLVAWTPQQLAVEDEDHALRLVPGAVAIDQVVASGARVWVRRGAQLAYLDRGGAALVPVALPAADGALAGIYGSPTGDVWVARAPAADAQQVTRYSLAAASGADAAWTTDVAPVFGRVCAHCHLPDGSSGVDLSTPALWRDERAEIRRRVVEAKSMPPAGTAMSDEDRAAIAKWASGS